MSRIIPASYQSGGSLPLTLLSWNVSLARPSAVAPDAVRRSLEAPRLLREACLASSPDVIALQECPHPTFGHEEFAPAGYVSMGTQPSHCGYVVDLLVRSALAERGAEAIRLPREHNLPSVAATIELPNEAKVAVSSSHLAPFKEGAYERLMQCQALMDALDRAADNCIHLGDFNMRAAEDRGVENLCGGGWVDAWKGAGSDPVVKFAWNSFANRYHPDAFKFRARFDRCYLRGGALSVTRFGFVGDDPVEGQGDYLSDHFGLEVGIDVAGR